MAIKFKNKIIDTASYNGIELTRISVNGELIFYQPYLYELPYADAPSYELAGVKTGETLSGEITLPTEYNLKRVECVGSDAFKNRTDVASVIIPEGYEEISIGAFQGSSIETLRIPESLWMIYSLAFANTQVKNVYIPSLNKWLGLYFSSGHANPLNGGGAKLYANNELITRLTIPEGVTQIKANAFYGYKNLTSLTIPEGVTSIGENALAYTGITSAHIPSTASVGSGAFSNSSLTTVTFAEGSKITEIPSRAFQNTHITSIKLPSTVTQIKANAFEGCSKLPSIYLPEGVERIEGSAFKDCSVLKVIVIPATLKNVEAAAFSGAGIQTVYYKGSKSDWKKITIDSTDNGALSDTKRLYYSETHPGIFNNPENYWYYDGKGIPTAYKSSCADGNHTPKAPATCDEPSICAICNNVIEEALGHDNKHYAKIDPTCTQTGREEYTECSRCGDITGGQAIPATGHTEEVLAAVDPTCTKPGKTEGKRCSKCGEVILAQTEIPATGHNWNAWIVDKEATEEAEGSKHRSCKDCGKKETQVIPIKGTENEPLLFTLNSDGVSFTVKANEGVEFTGELLIPSTQRVPSGSQIYPVTRIGKIGGTQVNPSKVILSSNIEEIEADAFAGCSRLQNITIHSRTKTIGAGAFAGCTNLRQVLIAAVDVKIGENAFSECPYLRYIFYKGNADEWGLATDTTDLTTPFAAGRLGASQAVVCYYSAEKPTSETETNFWYYNQGQISSDEALALIWPRDDLFNFVTALYTVEGTTASGTLLDRYYGIFVDAIDPDKLKGTIVLPQVYDGTRISGLAHAAFSKAEAMTGLIIPDTYKFIGDGALSYCYNLGSVFIPKSIEYIGDGAFHETTKYTPAGKDTWELVYPPVRWEWGGTEYAAHWPGLTEYFPVKTVFGDERVGWTKPDPNNEGEYTGLTFIDTDANNDVAQYKMEGVEGLVYIDFDSPSYFKEYMEGEGIKEYYAILNTNYEIVEFTELFQIDDEEAEDGIGWESSKYGKLKPTGDDENRYWTSDLLGKKMVDVGEIHFFNIPTWEKKKGYSEYHNGRTSLYFEAEDQGAWNSSWYRGMYHGKVTRHKAFSRLRDFSNSQIINEPSNLTAGKYYLETSYMATSYEAAPGIPIPGEGAPIPKFARLRYPIDTTLSTYSILNEKGAPIGALPTDAMLILQTKTTQDDETQFYIGVRNKGASNSVLDRPDEYFTLVYNGSRATLKLTENKETAFRIDRGAIVTEYNGDTYWLGIENPGKSTNIGLYKGSPHGEYTEHGTTATWNCSPGGFVIKDTEVSGTEELNASAEELNIPGSLYGNSITTIADNAFSGSVATGANIGNNIITIGGRAFAGSKLQAIKIPLNVEVIKSGAFAGCKGIKIYCATAGKPDTWADDWCDPDAEVVWCYCDDHQEQTEVVEATCNTSGATVHYCANCGYSYSTDVTPVLGHDWKVTGTVQPTCEAKGYTRRKCKTCGEISGMNFADALGHLYSETVQKPTCTQRGWTEYTCTRTGCTNWYRDNYTNPLGHVESEWETTKEPTATEYGWRQKYCTRCTAIIAREKIPALGCSAGHSYVATSVTEPTCEAEGFTTYTCSLCGDTYVGDFVQPNGHDYDAWETITQPTCINEGLRRKTCQDCGHIIEEVLPPIPGAHKYQLHENVEPTCEEGGYVTMKCSICGNEDMTYKEPIGHDWDIDVEVVEPTCGEQGYTVHTCNACGTTQKTNYTDPTGLHNWGEWTVIIPPDCTVEGEEKCTCTVCGIVNVAKIPMTDHTPSDWIIDKEPTTEEEGLKHKDCTVCGQYLGSNTIPKLEVEDTNTYLVTESGEFLTDEQGNLLIL